MYQANGMFNSFPLVFLNISIFSRPQNLLWQPHCFESNNIQPWLGTWDLMRLYMHGLWSQSYVLFSKLSTQCTATNLHKAGLAIIHDLLTISLVVVRLPLASDWVEDPSYSDLILGSVRGADYVSRLELSVGIPDMAFISPRFKTVWMGQMISCVLFQASCYKPMPLFRPRVSGCSLVRKLFTRRGSNCWDHYLVLNYDHVPRLQGILLWRAVRIVRGENWTHLGTANLSIGSSLYCVRRSQASRGKTYYLAFLSRQLGSTTAFAWPEWNEIIQIKRLRSC
jgi:hypothetical protein